ncbi:hypothetical protein GQX74_015027 [Glossina fuscipes]|nr:hypothetical protein GQX74_015027 [Glossina fuscipes]
MQYPNTKSSQNRKVRFHSGDSACTGAISRGFSVKRLLSRHDMYSPGVKMRDWNRTLQYLPASHLPTKAVWLKGNIVTTSQTFRFNAKVFLVTKAICGVDKVPLFLDVIAAEVVVPVGFTVASSNWWCVDGEEDEESTEAGEAEPPTNTRWSTIKSLLLSSTNCRCSDCWSIMSFIGSIFWPIVYQYIIVLIRAEVFILNKR